MIQVDHLSYEYPGLRALDDISFSVAEGGITALVGPNGAGKTTLLRCLVGLEPPLEGAIAIDGIDVLEHPREVHRRIGYLSDFFGVYEALTVRQCLKFAAGAQGVDEAAVAGNIEATAADVGLADRMHTRAGELSRGLRQRLGIGQAIIHAPKVLLLDEPASGLDPEARHALSGLLRKLRQRGMTIMVSSHILAELEEYSTDMLILHGGRIVEQRGISTEAAGDRRTRLRIELAENVADLRLRLETLALPGLEVAETSAQDAVVLYSVEAAARHALLKRLLAENLPVCGLVEEQFRMQDSYLASVRQAGAKDPA